MFGDLNKRVNEWVLSKDMLLESRYASQTIEKYHRKYKDNIRWAKSSGLAFDILKN